MSKTTYWVSLGLVAIVALLVGVYIGLRSQSRFGGIDIPTVHNSAESFDAGIYANQTEVIGSSGEVTIGGGTKISKFSCATATWDPGSLVANLATSTVATSTDIALSGAVLGDECVGSLTTASTSLVSVNCFISGTATATIRIVNYGNAAIDLGSGTAEVCYIH